jgi:hypothetical protein
MAGGATGVQLLLRWWHDVLPCNDLPIPVRIAQAVVIWTLMLPFLLVSLVFLLGVWFFAAMVPATIAVLIAVDLLKIVGLDLASARVAITYGVTFALILTPVVWFAYTEWDLWRMNREKRPAPVVPDAEYLP